MENAQLMQEFQTLERDIFLFLPQMPKGQVVTLGSLKAQVVSKFCGESDEQLKRNTDSIQSIFRSALRSWWKKSNSTWSVSSNCILFILLCMVGLFFFIHYAVNDSFPFWAIKLCGYVSLAAFLQNPFFLRTLNSIIRGWKYNRKIKNEIYGKLDEKLTKLESNRAFMTKSIRDYLGEVTTSFNNDYIKLDAKYRMIVSKPRERVERIVTRLDNQKKKIDQLKERVMSSEAKEFAKERIDKSILRHQKFIQDLTPKEEKLLQAAEKVGGALVELRQTVNDLDLESVEADYQAYEDSMDELGTLDQELIELRREHSQNIDFLNIELNALGRSIEGFRQSIQNCRSLIPTLSVAELPETFSGSKLLATSI